MATKRGVRSKTKLAKIWKDIGLALGCDLIVYTYIYSTQLMVSCGCVYCCLVDLIKWRKAHLLVVYIIYYNPPLCHTHRVHPLAAQLVERTVQQVIGPEEIFLRNIADFVLMDMSASTSNGKLNSSEITKVEDTIVAPEDGEIDADKNAEAFAELIQFLDDKSLSLIMRDASKDGRKVLTIL